MTDNAQLIERLYRGFNSRDIDVVLAALSEDVAWANGMEGGHVHGRQAVRAYWRQQWSAIDPRVDPLQIAERQDGSTTVEVHQVVKDLQGKLLLDETVTHVFHINGGHVTRFDIENAGGLSAISHSIS
jgi:hypothetical protein